MKWIFAFLFAFCIPLVFAQSPAVAPTPPVAVNQATPQASTDAATVAANPDAAPPAWATELLASVEKLPVVGPLVGKLLMYVGILGALMTALMSFLLALASALKNVTSWAGLATFAARVEMFQQSKIMYWLTTLSLFNAKAPPKPQTIADAVTKANP